MSEVVLSIENVSKVYHLGKINYRSLQQYWRGFWMKITKGEDHSAALALPHERYDKSSNTFYALRNVNLQIHKGDRVGIIGPNGAGKSTLLKIISKITRPTSGRVRIKGKVASMLEVGTGFHPELTGRENVFLNGAILGMTRKEVAKKYDQIVAFSELEQFMETPVKRYSSGMYVRLAFSIAAHLDSSIVILDEVLAVGDMHFHEKCMNKISEITVDGSRTVLFVSHNHDYIKRVCNYTIRIDQGTAGEKVAVQV